MLCRKSGKLSLKHDVHDFWDANKLDYISEEDFSKKFNLLAKLAPFNFTICKFSF